VITGFNTDIEHEGVLYHVQTEDKGLETPLMLTLVYTRGEILASKRVRYDDLIQVGFDEKVLAARLLRQHKLICAAVRAGRLEELKKMTERESAPRVPAKSEPIPPPTPPNEPILQSTQARESIPPPTPPKEPVHQLPPPKVESPPTADPLIASKSSGDTPKPALPFRPENRLPPPMHRVPPRVEPPPMPEHVPVAVTHTPPAVNSLHVGLVEEKDYRGGDRVTLNVRIVDGENHSQVIPGADVIVKILGSTFRPQIYQTKTGADGVASLSAEVPHFQSGRAAILVRATVGSVEAELRRIIQQG
jgi:hypothetical protein